MPINKGLLKSRFSATVLGFAAINVILALTLGGGGASLANVFKQGSSFTDPMYGTWTWWTVKAYFDQPKAPDVVLLGSSQMNSVAWCADAAALKQPVDCIEHRSVVALQQKLIEDLGANADVSVLNCAFQGAMASDYYMVCRALFTENRKPRLIIVGVSPRDFIDNRLPAASATEPFRFLSPFVDTGETSEIAYPDAFARINAQSEWTLNKLGLRRLHDIYSAWMTARVAENKDGVQRSDNPLLNAIRHSALKVKPGDYTVPADMRDVWVDNTNEYSSRYKNPNPPSYDIQLSFFSKFLAVVKEENIKTIVVGMPTLPMNRALLPESFWPTYRQRLADICTTNGAQWCDMSQSDQFEKHDFVDTVHVNTRGAPKLVAAFAHIIAATPQLAQSINPEARSASVPAATRRPHELAGVQQQWH